MKRECSAARERWITKCINQRKKSKQKHTWTAGRWAAGCAACVLARRSLRPPVSRWCSPSCGTGGGRRPQTPRHPATQKCPALALRPSYRSWKERRGNQVRGGVKGRADGGSLWMKRTNLEDGACGQIDAVRDNLQNLLHVARVAVVQHQAAAAAPGVAVAHEAAGCAVKKKIDRVGWLLSPFHLGVAGRINASQLTARCVHGCWRT